MLPWALGYGLAFKEGEGPVLPRLEDEGGLLQLDPHRVQGAIAPILETVQRCRAGLPKETVLIGFAAARSLSPAIWWKAACRRILRGSA